MANKVETQEAQINVSAEYKLETKDPRLNLVTVWFKITVTSFEWTDIYVGLAKRTGEWTTASHSFYELNHELRNRALSEARALLRKMEMA